MVAFTLPAEHLGGRREMTLTILLLTSLWGVVWGSDIAASETAEIRLVNGSSRCSGRVEVLHNNQWGTVCHDNWGMEEARVVCRQLGCSTAMTAKREAYFGRGTGKIWLDEVVCQGNEHALSQCQKLPWGDNNCHHGEDAGVVCSELRLAGGPTKCTGHVEILHNQQWGMVCGNGWTAKDAQVVCREMGCGDVLAATIGAKYGQVSGLTWMDGLNCTGEEESLRKCPAKPLAEYSCNSDMLAGVQCAEPPEIKLLEGSHKCSGRVEIFHEDVWGTICDNDWGLEDAEVVCRYLGCGTAISAPRGSRFGRGTGRIWMDGVNCTGKEDAISQCPAKKWGDSNGCSHYEEAGVVCAGVRLTNGSNRCSGRLEVYQNNQWRTVCDDDWNIHDASVVCRELDCGSALSVAGGAEYSQGSGTTGQDKYNCSGKENSLRDCTQRPQGEHSCDHGRAVSVNCSEPNQIRLVNGSSRCAGRVEILHNQEWGTVCDFGWTIRDAQVVCRELDCGTALSAPDRAHYGEGTGQIWLDYVRCAGTEATLRDCQLSTWGRHYCTHRDDVGVVCSELRLVNGSNHCSGRVELFQNEQWGTICDDGWGMKQAEVVCRELGCGVALRAPTNAYFGRGSGPIWKDDVNCVGTEAFLHECTSDPWGHNNCNHGEDAGVVCADPAEMRLVNGSSRCSGRVEVYHEQQYRTVCSHNWDINEATVVCRNLDCGTAIRAPHNAHFGRGKGPIWLSDLHCSGRESSLTECQTWSWWPWLPWSYMVRDCHHGEDAGVICSDDLRLVNGLNRCSGTVEVRKPHSEQWRTVCDHTWDAEDAAVVCRQLGCGMVKSVLRGAHFGEGSGSIWMDGLNCTGTEDAITDCRANTQGNNSCSPGQAAGVICSESSYINVEKIKLVSDPPNACAGRVEVFSKHQWGTVCDDRWDLDDATVVCKQLGCGMALEAPQSARFGRASGPILLDEVNCTGSEDSLTACKGNLIGEHDCDHWEDASVVCSGLFQVRLANGPNSCAGRVEVGYNGSWATIGETGWNLTEAEVVCRQLGCGAAVSAPVGNQYGIAPSRPFLDEVKCTGQESSLDQCRGKGGNSQTCRCDVYAGAVCTGKSGSSIAVTVILALAAVALLLGGTWLYLRKRKSGIPLWVHLVTRAQNACTKDIAFKSDTGNFAPATYAPEEAVHQMAPDTICLVDATSVSSTDQNN